MGSTKSGLAIEWTPQAKEDLQAIYEKLLFSGPNEMFANDVVEELLSKIMILSQMPQAWPREELLKERTREYRVLPIRTYKIIYHIEGNTVYIATVFDCR